MWLLNVFDHSIRIQNAKWTFRLREVIRHGVTSKSNCFEWRPKCGNGRISHTIICAFSAAATNFDISQLCHEKIASIIIVIIFIHFVISFSVCMQNRRRLKMPRSEWKERNQSMKQAWIEMMQRKEWKILISLCRAEPSRVCVFFDSFFLFFPILRTKLFILRFVWFSHSLLALFISRSSVVSFSLLFVIVARTLLRFTRSKIKCIARTVEKQFRSDWNCCCCFIRRSCPSSKEFWCQLFRVAVR